MKLVTTTKRHLTMQELAAIARRAAKDGVALTWSAAQPLRLELDGEVDDVEGVVDALTIGGVLAGSARGEA